MGNLRRYYYANKAKIWRIIFILAFIIGLIQLANYFVGHKSTQNKINQSNNNSETIDEIIQDTSLTTDRTFSGESINNTNIKKEITVIDDFYKLCNNKQFEEAYKLISNDCRECLFRDFNTFKTTYCDIMFSTNKTCITENWSGNTYKVRLTEDLLATGNTSQSMAIQDYVTVVKEDDEYKLNINNYIGRKNINKTTTKKDITIKVLNSDTFYEYENYRIQVKNGTNNTIYLDDGEKTSTLYVEDSNGIKYEASSGEIIQSSFIIGPGETRQFNIKFTNSYRSNRVMKKLVFEKLILNYNEYIKNISKYNNTTNFEADL